MGESPFLQDAREEAERIYFYADELVESITDLVTLHVSVESKSANESGLRTNEVMRFLTVFSALFLPLNFIASVYGMNFHHMPELDHPYGYYFVLTLMSIVGASIFLYFRRKGWLRRD
jgi:magnesium transporter